MYSWPIERIQSDVDRVTSPRDVTAFRTALGEAGYGPSLCDFLAPLLERFDTATFCNGGLRLGPIDGIADVGLPGLIDWNDAHGWRKFAPGNPAFYFMTNAFGDLLGIPLDARGEILRDRVAVIWTEKYQYVEAGIEWKNVFTQLRPDGNAGGFFGRLPGYEWVAGQLGRPQPWQCISSNVPVILGGTETIDNLALRPLTVHVSFTLQLLQQVVAQGKAPGSELAMVDLYDEHGRLLPEATQP